MRGGLERRQAVPEFDLIERIRQRAGTRDDVVLGARSARPMARDLALHGLRPAKNSRTTAHDERWRFTCQCQTLIV